MNHEQENEEIINAVRKYEENGLESFSELLVKREGKN